MARLVVALLLLGGCCAPDGERCRTVTKVHVCESTGGLVGGIQCRVDFTDGTRDTVPGLVVVGDNSCTDWAWCH